MSDTSAAATAGTDTTTATTTADTTTASAPANWIDSIDPETKNWAESKGWADPDPVKVLPKILQSGRNAEQLISKIKGDPNQILVMPKDPNNAEEMAAFREKLGVPRDVKDYGLDLENQNQKAFAEKAQALGISKDAAKGIWEFATQMGEQMQAAEAAKESEFMQKSEQEFSEWKKSQGMAADSMLQKAKSALHAFPALSKNSDAIERQLGTKAFMELMTELGNKIGEAGSGGGSDAGSNIMSPSMAKQAIQAIQQDSNKMKALFDDGHPAHAAIKQEWIKLHQFAAPN